MVHPSYFVGLYCTKRRLVKKMGGRMPSWLKLSFPGDYRGSANRIEVTATASASSGLVLTEEQRLKLIPPVSWRRIILTT
jgi:hypothetical protein